VTAIPDKAAHYRTAIPLFEELRGERVLLRPYQEADTAHLFEAIEESRDYLLKWIGFPNAHSSAAQSRDWIIRQKARWLLREDMPAGIWDISTGRYLGDCRLYPQSWESRYFSLSYWLRQSASGQGFMTEAVGLWVQFAFGTLQATRIEIRCDARNERSAAVARRLGFVLEGQLRNHMLAPDGTLRTSLIFSRIPEDTP
jgi:ribosomal-protein-serine acetyltransferase